MSGVVSSLGSFIRKPLVLIVLIGLAIRFILMPLLTYDFDIYHWAQIISNIESGNDLYELDGYYYTPVWGYLLGAISWLEELFVDIGQMAIRFTDMLPIEDLSHPYHIATITSITFNVMMKIPFVICDVVVGYIIYILLKDRTGDTKKATYGFALWFFCPIIIYMSSVQAMFDTFSALFLILTVFLVYKDKCFLGGMMFSIAVLLKFFPGFCIFVLLAYIVVKHRDDGQAKKKLLEAIAGFLIMTFVMMTPLILDGQMEHALSFITGRVGTPWTTAFMFFNVGIAILVALYLGHRMYRTPKENADSSMFVFILLTITASTLMSVTPQYVIVMIPFLIIHIISQERSYFKCWVIIGVSAFLGAFILNNLSLLTSLSEYTGLLSAEWVISGMQLLETEIFGATIISLLTTFANVFQYIGLWLILGFYFADAVNKRSPKIGGFILKLKNGGVRQ